MIFVTQNASFFAAPIISISTNMIASWIILTIQQLPNTSKWIRIIASKKTAGRKFVNELALVKSITFYDVLKTTMSHFERFLICRSFGYVTEMPPCSMTSWWRYTLFNIIKWMSYQISWQFQDHFMPTIMIYQHPVFSYVDTTKHTIELIAHLSSFRFIFFRNSGRTFWQASARNL